MPRAQLDLTKYSSAINVRANFITTSTGKYTDASGSSRGLGKQTDRELLIHLRSLADVVVAGGSTARAEEYRPTSRFETIIITHRSAEDFPGLTVWNDGSDKGLENLISTLCEAKKKVLIEAGPTLLARLLKLGQVQQLCLTIVGHNWNADALFSELFGMPAMTLDTAVVIGDLTFTTWH